MVGATRDRCIAITMLTTMTMATDEHDDDHEVVVYLFTGSVANHSPHVDRPLWTVSLRIATTPNTRIAAALFRRPAEIDEHGSLSTLQPRYHLSVRRHWIPWRNIWYVRLTTVCYPLVPKWRRCDDVEADGSIEYDDCMISNLRITVTPSAAQHRPL